MIFSLFLLFFKLLSVRAEPDFEISRIHFIGVQAFQQTVIESVLSIKPGDRLEKQKVIQTEKNIQELYRYRGYPKVFIQSKLTRKKKTSQEPSFETVLEFFIEEGKPVRIADINIHLKGEGLEDLKNKIISGIDLKVGDIFDQERLLELQRAIHQKIILSGYLKTKVSCVEAFTSTYLANLQCQIDVGKKASFSFRGNHFFPSSYLSSLVKEQRLFGLGKNEVETIKEKIEEEYKSSGFSKVKIDTYIFEKSSLFEQQISYAIREGPRVKIEGIEFDGNTAFSSKVLKDYFYLKASPLVQNHFYVEKEVQKAAELMIQSLKESGYLSAKLITVHTVYLPKIHDAIKDSKVKLVIYLFEGDQTLVRSVSSRGVSSFSEDEIQSILGVTPGKSLNLFNFNEGLEALKKKYRDLGYLNIKIINEGTDSLVRYSKESLYADVFLDVDEDKKFHISKIEISGLKKTKEQVVRRELTIKEGDCTSEQFILENEIQLRKLGIFSSVSMKILDDPHQTDFKIVRILLSETDRGLLTWGPGYRNDLGARAFGQLAYSNILGENHTASINLAVNRRFYLYHFPEGQAQLAYSWPWFAVPKMTFRPVVSLSQTQYINFSAASVTASVSWERALFVNPNIQWNITYTLERISQFNAVQPEDNQQLRIGTVTPKITLDLRDNALAPNRGFYSVVWCDFSYPFLGSQTSPYSINYYRLQFRSDYHLPVIQDIVLYFSFRTGYEKNDQPIDNNVDAIPLIKQFSLGGIGSLRGYQQQELNFQNQIVQGSLSYVNYRTQVDLPFVGALKFGLFLDAANLLMDQFSFGNLLYGAGFGFHYHTPVGPVSFDWGFKLNPLPGADPSVVSFSVGVI